MTELLNSKVKENLEKKYQQLRDAGELISADELKKCYATFKERFGLDVLENLDGEELLETMHNSSNRDSLVYWLEFKNDDEFPARFGSIAGGSSLKFGIYKRAESGEWTTGSPTKQRSIQIDEAISIAKKHRNQIINGAKEIAKLNSKSSESDYINLQKLLMASSPNICDLAWGHKYFSLIFPDILDDYHNVKWQIHHLIKLHIIPPEDLGRYHAAFYFRSIAQELKISLNSLTTTLNSRDGSPHKYWRIGTRLGGKDSIWKDMQEASYTAVGFHELGNLSDLQRNKSDKEKLKSMMKSGYKDWNPTKIGNQTAQLFNFVTVVGSNDIIIACDGETVLGIGKNIGEYEYSPNSSHPHRRSIDWVDFAEWKLPEPTEVLRTTFKEVKKHAENMVAIEKVLFDSFNDPLDVDSYSANVPNEDAYYNALKSLEQAGRLTSRHKSMLLHHLNSPNHVTSATRMAASLNFNNYSGANGAYGHLSRMICQELALEFEYHIAVLANFERDESNNIQWAMHPSLAKALEDLNWKAKSTFPTKKKFSKLTGISGDIQDILNRKKQVILYGPPGTGKTYWANLTTRELSAQLNFECHYDDLNESQENEILGKSNKTGLVRYCCFHPEYGYEHFIEGYWPQETNGQIVFGLRDGIFKNLCKDAEKSEDKTFFLIIDEINRGDMPRIFGELLTLIEADKRGISITLPYSGDVFTVPTNIRIIGTMNTADRSIALLDTALRRRFGFIELMPDTNILSKVVLSGIPIGLWLKNINKRICENLGHDARNLQIGHAYFMNADKPIIKFNQFKQIIKEDIIPLLEEYCYEDYRVLERILGSAVVDSSKLRIRKEIFDLDDETKIAEAFLSEFPDLSSTKPVIEKEEEEEITDDELETDE
jgi:hypothetical protein